MKLKRYYHGGISATLLTAALLTLPLGPLRAAGIQFDGVLGNSGEAGATLVRFAGSEAAGMGVAVDKYFSIWDRGGSNQLNRYAADGRLIASYPLPNERPNPNTDVITCVEDTVLLRLGRSVYALGVDSPAGTAPTHLKVAADLMSFGNSKGAVAALDGTELFLLRPTGEKSVLGTVKAGARSIEIRPDGTVYIMAPGSFTKIAPGTKEEVNAGTLPGERPQFLDDAWFGHAWHSTIRRFDAGLNPAPGVVYGGNSGSFIGHVEEQADVRNGRGLAKLGPGLYAVSGMVGVVHLLAWSPEQKRLETVRRLGAVQSCTALGLDRQGRIWHGEGSWNWDDGPADAQKFGIPAGDLFSANMMDTDVMVAYGTKYGKPALIYGSLKSEPRIVNVAQELPAKVAAATLVDWKRRGILIIGTKGELGFLNVGGNGSPEGVSPAPQLALSQPVKTWSSLVQIKKDTLWGVGDGAIIELVRDGDNYKETRRLTSLGETPEWKLGAELSLAADAGRIWISDTTRHRVLCIDGTSLKLLGSFGNVDTAGEALAALNRPTTIAARGTRAVVYDSGNQRIMKVELEGIKTP